jgi:hypothetical protein
MARAVTCRFEGRYYGLMGRLILASVTVRRLGLLLVVVTGCTSNTGLSTRPADAGDAAFDADRASGDSLVVAQESGSNGDLTDAGAVDARTDLAPAASCGSQVTFRLEPDPDADPGTLCLYGCEGISSATISSGSTQFRAAGELQPGVAVVWGSPPKPVGCATLCDTCEMGLCHSCPARLSPFANAIDATWDGSYFIQGTCSGTTCAGPNTCAPAGHYVVTFCVHRGVSVDNLCVPLFYMSGFRKEACTSVELDLPITVALPVRIGTNASPRATPDAGAGPGLADFVGTYLLHSSSAMFFAGTGSSSLSFMDVSLSIAPGTVSDFVVTTNPVPGDYPDTCDIPVNLTLDAQGNWSLQNPLTTCTAGGATAVLYAGYYTVATANGNLAVSGAGITTGGAKSNANRWGFAYTGVAVPSGFP